MVHAFAQQMFGKSIPDFLRSSKAENKLNQLMTEKGQPHFAAVSHAVSVGVSQQFLQAKLKGVEVEDVVQLANNGFVNALSVSMFGYEILV